MYGVCESVCGMCGFLFSGEEEGARSITCTYIILSYYIMFIQFKQSDKMSGSKSEQPFLLSTEWVNEWKNFIHCTSLGMCVYVCVRVCLHVCVRVCTCVLACVW